MHIGVIKFSVCSKRGLVQKWKFLFMYDLKVCLTKNVEDLFGKWIGAKKENYFHFFFDAKMENYFFSHLAQKWKFIAIYDLKTHLNLEILEEWFGAKLKNPFHKWLKTKFELQF